MHKIILSTVYLAFVYTNFLYKNHSRMKRLLQNGILFLVTYNCLFELLTALLEYLNLLQRGCSPPALQVATPI